MTPNMSLTIAERVRAPRRALSTRDTAWARALARWLGRIGVRPNAVSVAGILFAIAGCVAFFTTPALAGRDPAVALLVAAATIQLRLLCNLLDGMLAIEEGFTTSIGEIYNDLPDRIADVVLLAGAGYSLRGVPFGPALGWLAAVTAVFTAYVRLLGGSLGTKQHFVGPMAKQHRMFTLTIASLLAAAESIAGTRPRAMLAGLVVIAAGSIVTAVRRTRRIAQELEAR
jgi:phosphatidylglycerophosphate synthase